MQTIKNDTFSCLSTAWKSHLLGLAIQEQVEESVAVYFGCSKEDTCILLCDDKFHQLDLFHNNRSNVFSLRLTTRPKRVEESFGHVVIKVLTCQRGLSHAPSQTSSRWWRGRPLVVPVTAVAVAVMVAVVMASQDQLRQGD